jgi:mannosyltransferase
MARTPWHEFWPVLRYVDAVLAPYYVLMHAWVSVFGDSDLALRIPSLLAMAAAAGLTGALGARLAGPGAGLLAGIVFGLLPSTSRFGAEARPYALVVFAAVAATYLLLRAWERPTAVRWAGYAGAVAMLSLLHVVAVLGSARRYPRRCWSMGWVSDIRSPTSPGSASTPSVPTRRW